MKHYYFLLLILFVFSCKNDQTDQNISGEQEYFEDYEEPLYKWGYIDTEGNKVIESKYDDLRPFQGGLARANYKGKWGFIDKTGNDVIHFKYRGTFPFKDGLARVQNFEKKYGFINKSDEMVIPDTLDLVFDFNSDRARAKQGELYGYISSDGKWIIEPQFKKCANFENGHARVYQFGKAAIIDKAGAFKIPYEDGNEKMFSTDSDIIRAKKGKKYRYYSLKNYKVIKDDLLQGTDFQDGICGIKTGENTWEVVNESFKKQFEIEAETIKYAGENRWIVKNDGTFSLVNEKGEKLTESAYDMIFEFSEGFAPFEKNEKWGYLDLEGKEVVAAKFPLAWEFKEGIARTLHKGVNYLNKDLKVLFPEGFVDAHNFSEGLAHVQE